LLTDGAVLNFDGTYHGDINIYINNYSNEEETLVIEEQSEEIELLGNEST